ncbi:ATP-binding protein [Saccharopolyspora shandongensis]|uniref:ATP-binding protein n=1 Tax=Saccharopolyspora shandongensis TaxID=418495 RepID=UPI003403780D
MNPTLSRNAETTAVNSTRITISRKDRVRDNGRGIGNAAEGAGIRGMRERALLIGAELTLGPRPGGGTEVRLHVPTATKAPAHV